MGAAGMGETKNSHEEEEVDYREYSRLLQRPKFILP